MTACTLCPRDCNINRAERCGFCGVSDEILISKVMLHMWEEPCISGTRGSGAIFFCGCPLGCAFCQNRDISRRGEDGLFAGQRVFSISNLADTMLRLQNEGAHNINLVSPTQYTDALVRCVAEAKKRGLTLPVVWNTGGYEKRETVRSLDGTVDIFLTDVKYFSHELSAELSKADDYFTHAMSALEEMIKTAGTPEYDEFGIMTRGVVIRHLVLPGCRKDSAEILRRIAHAGLQGKAVLSLMSQYTPDFFTGCADAALERTMRRRVTSFEYNYVRDLAAELGFTGYGQERDSAQSKYTPEWGH